jgi:hypothetical protein
MTIIATGIAFVLAVISIVGILAQEKEMADEAKRLHLNKLRKNKE